MSPCAFLRWVIFTFFLLFLINSLNHFQSQLYHKRTNSLLFCFVIPTIGYLFLQLLFFPFLFSSFYFALRLFFLFFNFLRYMLSSIIFNLFIFYKISTQILRLSISFYALHQLHPTRALCRDFIDVQFKMLSNFQVEYFSKLLEAYFFISKHMRISNISSLLISRLLAISSILLIEYILNDFSHLKFIQACFMTPYMVNICQYSFSA